MTAASMAADIGGTFTDLVLEAHGTLHTLKLLTTHAAPEEAVLAGSTELLARAGLQPQDLGLFVHGTTLATNALIERRGAPTALLTTSGFRDTLDLGTESRFDQYDLRIQKPAPLVPREMAPCRCRSGWRRMAPYCCRSTKPRCTRPACRCGRAESAAWRCAFCTATPMRRMNGRLPPSCAMSPRRSTSRCPARSVPRSASGNGSAPRRRMPMCSR